MKKILILGGGFGGIYTAHYLLRELRKEEARVTLINESNYFLFVPMLHEVATGNIRVHNIVEPIRQILDGENFRFCKATVNSINLESEVVNTNVGEFDYDILVNALGSETNFFGLEGKEHALTLKDLDDAYKMRRHIINKFEEANVKEDKEARIDCLTFVVVGGGPTGVELSCEISELIHNNFAKEYPNVNMDEVSVHLIDPNDKVLKGIDEKLRDKAMNILERKGINLHMGGLAQEVGESYVKFEQDDEEKKLTAGTIIWTAGVKPRDMPVKGVEKERGALPVNSNLQVEGYEDVYALGDFASYENPKNGQHPPPTAQLAQQQAKAVSTNILNSLRGRDLESFEFESKGFLASMGNGQAIAKIGPVRFYGFPAWWMWRTIYLSKLIGLENKFRVMLDWTFDLFFSRDSSEI